MSAEASTDPEPSLRPATEVLSDVLTLNPDLLEYLSRLRDDQFVAVVVQLWQEFATDPADAASQIVTDVDLHEPVYERLYAIASSFDFSSHSDDLRAEDPDFNRMKIRLENLNELGSTNQEVMRKITARRQAADLLSRLYVVMARHGSDPEPVRTLYHGILNQPLAASPTPRPPRQPRRP